ncbi:6741_t:CDS:2 [Acaulospora morrowiae]|uniref:6741_t:CDS:1 n=1 Tax=Acaulospora morrowiae TaxID=94023 RepID=A0A9N9FTT5_9GLOM|nr:6741_t:CDS:2 [Acaulospora morrowiae]
MEDDYESVLLVIRECYVYKLPPRTSSREYRAAEWGDMEAFMWKGRLRIIAVGEKCFIKLEDGITGRHALIGMGFQERSEAFDFQVALQDHVKHVKAEREAIEHAKVAALEPKKDYSLKEGETICINIGHQRKSRPHTISNLGGSETAGVVPLLPPPPSAASIKHKNNLSISSGSRTTRRPPSNEFGEFKAFENDSTDFFNNAG